MDLSNQTYLVIGLARSGIAAAKLLVKLNATVIVNDIKSKEELGSSIAEIENLPVIWALSKTPDALLDEYDKIDCIILSPGVPFFAAWVERAKRKSIPVINEMQLAYELQKMRWVAITGTNGKTTTTSLLNAILLKANKDSWAMGNIGAPVANKVLELNEESIIVAEVAASQLVSLTTWKPDISMILNISEDHLDWFETMERYVAAKSLIYKNQTHDDICILNADDKGVLTLAKEIPSKILYFSLHPQTQDGAYVEKEHIILQLEGKKRPLCHVDDLLLPGQHNLANALAASLCAALLDVEDNTIVSVLKTFQSVEHRIEKVATVNGITYINDSKGTNPDSTLRAIESMQAETVLLLGGFDKQTDYTPLLQNLPSSIVHLILLGQTAEKLEHIAKALKIENYSRANSFEEAVALATKAAKPGMNVLLSPASASWDMFDSFEQRGETFKKLVFAIEEQA